MPPLGLPEGSVRALQSLLITLALVVIALVWGIHNPEAAFAGVAGLAGYAVKDYLSSRKS